MFVIPNQNIETENCDISHQMLFQTPLFEIVVKDIDNKQLAENDYIEPYVECNGGTFYNYMGSGHSHFWGLLVH